MDFTFDERMRTLYFLIIILAASTSAADTLLWEGDHKTVDWMELPSGYYWRDIHGIDSLPGEILTGKGGIVHFDIGFSPPFDASKSKSSFTRHKTRGGIDVFLSKAIDIPHGYTARISGANGSFYWRSYDQAYTDEIVEALGSFNYDKFIAHAKRDLSRRPLNRTESVLPIGTQNKKVGTIVHRITPAYGSDRIQNVIASDLFRATQEQLYFEPVSVEISEFGNLHSLEVTGISQYHDFDLRFRFVYAFGSEATYRVHQWAPEEHNFQSLPQLESPDHSPIGTVETLEGIRELVFSRLPFLRQATIANLEMKKGESNQSSHTTPASAPR